MLPLPEVSASPIAAWSLLHRWNVLKKEGIQVEVLRPFGQDMNFEANNLKPQFSTSRAMFERFGRQKCSQQQRTAKEFKCILQNNFASYVGHPRICTSLLYPVRSYQHSILVRTEPENSCQSWRDPSYCC